MSTTSAPPPKNTAPTVDRSRGDTLIGEHLEAVRAALWRSAMLNAVLRLLGAWMAGVLLFSIVDHWIWGMGRLPRLACLCAAIIGSAWWIYQRIVPLIRLRISLEYAAHRVEHETPELKHALTSYVTLRSERDTPGLRGIVVRSIGLRAARQLQAAGMTMPTETTGTLRLSLAVVAIFAVLALYTALLPNSTGQSLQRLAAPLADLAPPTRVQIKAVAPGDSEALYGRPLPIEAEIRGLLSRDPAEVVVQPLAGPPRSFPLNPASQDRIYQVTVPGESVEESFDYWVRAGDAQSDTFRITVRDEPSLVIQNVTYNPPAYTKLPTKRSTLATIEALAGTTVTVTATTNRPMASGRIEFNPRKVGSKTSATAGFAALQIANDGRSVSATWNLRATIAGGNNTKIDSYRLVIEDDEGNTNPDPVVYPIRVIPDLAPEVRITVPETWPKDVPLGSQQLIEVRALDPDFGLSELSLRIRRKNRIDFDPILLESNEGLRGNQVALYRFRPDDLGYTLGDVITIEAVARDNRPRQNTNRPLRPGSAAAMRGTAAATMRGTTVSDPVELHITKRPPGTVREDGDGLEPKNQQPSGAQNADNSGGDAQENQDGAGGGAAADGAASSKGEGQGSGGSGGSSDSQNPPNPSAEQNSGNGQGSSSDSDSQPNPQGSESSSEQASSNNRPSQNEPSENNSTAISDSSTGGSGNNSDPSNNDNTSPDAASNPNETSGSDASDSNPTNPEQSTTGNQAADPSGNSTDASQSDPSAAQPGSNQPGSRGNSASDGQQTPRQPPTSDGEAMERIRDFLDRQSNGDSAANPSDNSTDPTSDGAGNDASSRNAPQDGNNEPDGNQQDGSGTQNGNQADNSAQNDTTGDQQTGNQGDNNPSGTNPQNQSGTNQSSSGETNDNERGDSQSSKNSGTENNDTGETNGSGGENGTGENESQSPAGDPGSPEDSGSPNESPSGDATPNADASGSDTADPNGNNSAPAANEDSANAADSPSGNENGDGSQAQPPSDQATDSAPSTDQPGPPSPEANGGSEANGGNESNGGDQSNESGSQDPPAGEEAGSDAAGADGSSTGNSGTGSSPDSATRPGGDAQSSPSSSGGVAGSGNGDANPMGTRSGDAGSAPPAPDPVDLEAARRATDMVLDALEHQRDRPNQELLDELGWTPEQLRQFIDRWQQARRLGRSGTPAQQQQFEEALQSLGIRRGAYRGNERAVDRADRLRNVRDSGGATQAPPQFRDRIQRVLDQLNRQ